jgi:hypothetical protein
MISDKNPADMVENNGKSSFQKWCGAQNFAFNVILEFLKLEDIVKILTIVHRSEVKFVPSTALLNEIFKKALSTNFSKGPRKFRAALPTLLMISKSDDHQYLGVALVTEERTLTLQTMINMYKIIKGSITNECSLCSAITADDKTCTFWKYAEEGLSFKVSFASSQCSDRECNQIVLWHCNVCMNPCSECLEHVASCEYCDGNMCKNCLLTEDLCKNCGFICVGCENVLIRMDEGDDDNKLICDVTGPNCVVPAGPYCLDCADYEELDIWHCWKCYRMACKMCRPVTYCHECKSVDCRYNCNQWCCEDCKPNWYEYV